MGQGLDIKAKFMNITPDMILGLEKILNYLVDNSIYGAQIGNIAITYKGTKESSADGKRQIFEIQRMIKEEL